MTEGPSRTRIKVCGMTRPGDIRLAGELGVDAVGLVFTARSRRCVALDQAPALRAAALPLVQVVALFMDDDAACVRRAIAAARPALLQFHGSEPDAFCAQFGLPWLKGVGLGGDGAPASATDLLALWPGAAGFVLDGHGAGQPGGSGLRLDPVRIPRDIGRPWLLAGGLDAGNVEAAIDAVAPFGVDVSSGVEHAPGVKDGAAMAAFVAAVRKADARRSFPAPAAIG